MPEIRILKPAQLTVANNKLLYHLVYKDKDSNRWELFNDDQKKVRFEWYLVRLDQYGNTMFMTKVGDNHYFELKIPSNPQYYKLYVEAICGEDVKMVTTALNTPLK